MIDGNLPLPRSEQVLNWDLRPVTIYDFVRAFCDLIPPASGTPTSLGTRRDESEVDELRVGAEEIADLSTCGKYGGWSVSCQRSVWAVDAEVVRAWLNMVVPRCGSYCVVVEPEDLSLHCFA